MSLPASSVPPLERKSGPRLRRDPQQHQLLLGIAGYTGRGWATISELAEFLQECHNSVVELVERSAQRGLVRKEQDARDRRFVRVHLASRGQRALEKLTGRHREELARIQTQIPTAMGIGGPFSKVQGLDAKRGRYNGVGRSHEVPARKRGVVGRTR